MAGDAGLRPLRSRGQRWAPGAGTPLGAPVTRLPCAALLPVITAGSRTRREAGVRSRGNHRFHHRERQRLWGDYQTSPYCADADKARVRWGGLRVPKDRRQTRAGDSRPPAETPTRRGGREHVLSSVLRFTGVRTATRGSPPPTPTAVPRRRSECGRRRSHRGQSKQSGDEGWLAPGRAGSHCLALSPATSPLPPPAGRK